MVFGISSAQAQRATLVKLPTGQHIGIAYTSSGEMIVLTNIQILELPSPTPPPAKIKRAIVVIESGASTQETAILIAGIRNNQTLSRKVVILDPDTKNEQRKSDPQIQAAIKLMGEDVSFPALIGLDGDGKPVLVVPIKKNAKVSDIELQLKKWGL
jgi:hypothetical protein